MKGLSTYIFRTVFSAILLVLLLLVGLELVFRFIGELDEVKGNYTAAQALIYIFLGFPLRVYDLLPIAALIGGMTGLGMLASNSELTVMRASGISIGRIVWWTVKPAFLFIFVGLLLGQFVIPTTESMAIAHKAKMQMGQGYATALRGSWQRENGDFLQVGQVDAQGNFHHGILFNFSEQGRLEKVSTIEAGTYSGEQQWSLQNLKGTEILETGRVRKSQQDEQVWQGRLTPEFLLLVTQDVESLSLTDLYRYAHYMKEQGLDAGVYFLQFWKKALAPLATLSMVLIACSFIFGPLRSVTMGLRIVAGVLAGLAFRYGQDFLGYASLVFDFSPVLAAGLPVLFCLLIGGVAIIRVK